MILSAIRHATAEAWLAASHADNAASKARVALDFITSRLLKSFRLPNYNAARQVSLDDLKINYRFNRGDLQSLKEVFLDGAYALPFQPRTILDLGANIGLASLWLWKQYQPEKIIAVEPDSQNAELAAHNLATNRVPGEVLQAAVGAISGKAWFAPRAESNLGEVFNEDDARSKHAVEVAVVGIGDLVARFGSGGVDLVKMDIEGAEKAVFGGDLAWLQQVRALVVEFHDDRVESAALIRRVESAGFHHSLINETRQANLSLFRHLRSEPWNA